MNKDTNNNNNNNNNNEYNIKLYNSVFNNIYLKRIILYHLNIFNISSINFEFGLIEWQQFKYKDYLNKVTLRFERHLNQLPENIKHIVIPSPPPSANINEIINSIPSHIESFGFIGSLEPEHLESINSSSSSSSTINPTTKSKLKNLTLNLYYKRILIQIPSSITSLNISGSNYKLVSNSHHLLYSGRLKYDLESFEDGCLPESLTDVVFYHDIYSRLVNQFSFSGLIRLEFECREEIKSDIRFPNTLQHLKIKCITFNTTLPSSLKWLSIEMICFEYEIQFPPSLEHLTFFYDKKIIYHEVFKSSQSAPTNLKSLMVECSSIVDYNGDSILPDTLESFTLLCFNTVLKENQLPSSLTHLKLGFTFKQAIDINALPSGLKILELPHDYSHVINPLSIPSSLQLLRITNTNYNHPIKLTPSSHPNTLIDCYDLNLYYDPSNTDIKSLKLPHGFNSPLSTLQLQDKCNLNHLHLGLSFDQPIQISHLPYNNQIKILELCIDYSHTLNLNHFKNLESIIINDGYGLLNKYSINITTTIDDNGIYNYYNLKDIQLSKPNSQLLKHLDINFYKFIKLNKSPIKK